MNAARQPHVSAGAPTPPGIPVVSGSGPHHPPSSPAARRLSRPTWRDPRLVAGVVMVAVSVLVGAKLLAGADDTVAVWSARGDLAAGASLETAALEVARVRFSSEDLAGRYLPADGLPEGVVLLRDVAAGELLPRAALGDGPAETVAELPVALASEAVPAGLRVGELVDVWVTPPAEGGEDRRAVLVLEQVRVVAAPQGGSALGPSASRQVVVAVPGEDDALLAQALGRLADGAPVLVRRG